MPSPENPTHKLLRRNAIAFLIVSFILSIALTTIGTFLQNIHKTLSIILTTIGGSGLGTCLGLTIGSVTGTSAVTRIKELIESTLDNSTRSEEATLKPFRQIWHHYLLTSVNGKLTWRYRKIDMSQSETPGKLTAIITTLSPKSSKKHSYSINGFVVGTRLVIYQNATEGAEMPAIHLYPSAVEKFRDIIAGIAYIQSWDGIQFQSIALMSNDPIDLKIKDYPEGSLPDSAGSILYETWNREAPLIGLQKFKQNEFKFK